MIEYLVQWLKKYFLKVLAIASEFFRMVLLSMMALGDVQFRLFREMFFVPLQIFFRPLIFF